MENQQTESPAENKVKQTVPSKIHDYISNYFEGNSLTDIHTYKDRNGNYFHNVDIGYGDTLYRLKFSATGLLLQKKTEPLFELYTVEENKAS